VRPDLIGEIAVSLNQEPENAAANGVATLAVIAMLKLPERYHPLQAKLLPVMRAIADAWADRLVQLRVRDYAKAASGGLGLDRVWDRHTSILSDDDELSGTAYPTQLRPAALRVARQPPRVWTAVRDKDLVRHSNPALLLLLLLLLVRAARGGGSPALARARVACFC